MSIAIKVPVLPYAAAEARLGHWYKAVGEVVARNEVLVELLVRDEVIPILASQAGIVERILIPQNQLAGIGTVIAYLKTGLPNLVWDAEQGALILDTYRADVTASMEYDLRQMLRVGEGKYANGFGSALALPQIETPHQEHGQEHGHGYGYGEEANAGHRLKSHPSLANSSQFSGNHKDPRVNTVPSNPEAERAPQNAPTLGAQLHLSPRAPTPKPHN